MDTQNIKYKTRKVTVTRDKKESTLAKMQAAGWELVEQLDGTSRSMLSFRKPAKSQTVVLAIASSVVVVVFVAVVALFVLSQRPGGTSAETVAGAETSVAVSPTGDSSDAPDYLSPTEGSETSDGGTAALTPVNNPDFAQILAGPEYCSDYIESFAMTYAGEIVEFDGHVTDVRPGKGQKSVFDALIRAGDPGDKDGPVFKFIEGSSDVDPSRFMSDSSEPIVRGQSIHIVAKVKSYDFDNCLFYLEPVKTSLR